MKDLEPIGGHSIWVYKLKASGDGYELVHVSLTREQVQSVLDNLFGVDAGDEPSESRPFIFGKVYRSVGEEIVEITPEEVGASVLARLYLDASSMTQFGMLEFVECTQVLLGR